MKPQRNKQVKTNLIKLHDSTSSTNVQTRFNKVQMKSYQTRFKVNFKCIANISLIKYAKKVCSLRLPSIKRGCTTHNKILKLTAYIKSGNKSQSWQFKSIQVNSSQFKSIHGKYMFSIVCWTFFNTY